MSRHTIEAAAAAALAGTAVSAPIIPGPEQLRQMATGFRIVRFMALVRTPVGGGVIGKSIDRPVEAQGIGNLVAVLCEALADAQERIARLEAERGG